MDAGDDGDDVEIGGELPSVEAPGPNLTRQHAEARSVRIAGLHKVFQTAAGSV